jgi:hypothetical protein
MSMHSLALLRKWRPEKVRRQFQTPPPSESSLRALNPLGSRRVYLRSQSYLAEDRHAGFRYRYYRRGRPYPFERTILLQA